MSVLGRVYYPLHRLPVLCRGPYVLNTQAVGVHALHGGVVEV